VVKVLVVVLPFTEQKGECFIGSGEMSSSALILVTNID